MKFNLRFGVLLALLLFGNVELAMLSHGKPMPLRRSFSQFPSMLGDWTGREASTISSGEAAVLKADDYVWRTYERRGVQLSLFVAYYRSQQAGDTLHSPKNCLPGAGWRAMRSENIQMAGANRSFPANHMIIARDETQYEVVYWYQANKRVFASEYAGKLYLAYDAISKGRTDGAIVRIMAPYDRSGNSMAEIQGFARELSAVLPQFLPN